VLLNTIILPLDMTMKNEYYAITKVNGNIIDGSNCRTKVLHASESACWPFWAPLFCLGVIVFVAPALFIVYSMRRYSAISPPQLLLMLLLFVGGVWAVLAWE